MTCIEERQRLKKLSRRSPAEVEQERQNEAARIAELNRPRHQKAMPACAFVHAKKREMVKEAVEYFQRPSDERAKDVQPTVEELRKEISREHRKLQEGGDPSRLKELLAKKRRIAK